VGVHAAAASAPHLSGCQVEEAIKAKAFQTVAIARPGLLDRGAARRAVERFASKRKER
jgi:hypothetical protein